MGSLLAHHGLFTTRFNPHVILLKRDSERRLWLLAGFGNTQIAFIRPKSYISSRGNRYKEDEEEFDSNLLNTQLHFVFSLRADLQDNLINFRVFIAEILHSKEI